jgi:putative lipoic acid-binding regulatory protein
MSRESSYKELLEFPCHFEFKAFGPGDNDETFLVKVLNAISSVVPVSRQATKSRPSSAGKYQCVSALVTLQNRTQLEAVYAALRKIDDLKYLL